MAKKKKEKRGNFLKITVAVLVIFGVLNVFKLLSFSSDILWEIKTGQIVSKKTIFIKDTYLNEFKKDWICFEWLSTTLLYRVYKIGNFTGLKYFFIFLFFLIILILYQTAVQLNAENKTQFWIFIFPYFLLFVPLLELHLSLVNLFFLSTLLLILTGMGNNKNKVRNFLIFVLFLVWANSSSLFILGIAIIIFFRLETIVQKNKKISSQKILFIMLLAVLGVIFNPAGIKIYYFSFLNTFTSIFFEKNELNILKTFCFLLIIFINLSCLWIKIKNKDFKFSLVILFGVLYFLKDLSFGITFITLPFMVNTFRKFGTTLYYKYKLNLLEKDFSKIPTQQTLQYIFYILNLILILYLLKPMPYLELSKFNLIYNYIKNKKPQGIVFSDMSFSNYLFFKAGKLKPLLDGRTIRIYNFTYLYALQRFFNSPLEKALPIIKNSDFACIKDNHQKQYFANSLDFIFLKNLATYEIFINTKKENWKYLKNNEKIVAQDKFTKKLVNKSVYYAKKEKFVEAISLLSEAQKIQPKNLDILLNLGTIKLKQNLFPEGEKIFIQILKLNANYLPALYNLAYIFNQEKNYNQSIKIYKNILVKYPQEELAYKLLKQTQNLLNENISSQK